MEEQSQPLERTLPLKNEVRRALGAFSPIERLAFTAAMILMIVAVISLVYKINSNFLVSIPGNGGTLNEGVVGTPRFVNPLLATTDADRDLTALVYRGLLKKDSNGDLVPDVAESFTVSSDGLTYTFILKDTLFQDGEKLTADDVVFTIKSVQDATLKSTLRVAWEGVLAKAIDEKTVTFTLKRPYAPFLSSTTLGILPKHIWGSIAYDSWAYSNFNTTNAVGEGLYKIKTISQNSSGVPDSYELTATRMKNGPTTRIDTIIVHFYASENELIAAYKAGNLDTIGGVDPENAQMLAESGGHVLSAPLPRVFGLFFNQSQAKVFADASVRKAVSLAINKDTIVENVLKSYGETVAGPIPGSSALSNGTTTVAGTANAEQAKTVLEKAGWKLGDDGVYFKKLDKKDKGSTRLSFEIATNDTPELTEATNLMVSDLRAAGIEAVPKIYETGSLNQDIIRPRKFQALFFGEVVSTPSDLYAFWHSSQRNDPGLNISGYANSKVDKLLEQGLATLDADKQTTTYAALEKEITGDVPAVFIYSPSYIYVAKEGLTGVTLGTVAIPSDRFANIGSWYINTDRVWKIFAPKNK